MATQNFKESTRLFYFKKAIISYMYETMPYLTTFDLFYGLCGEIYIILSHVMI